MPNELDKKSMLFEILIFVTFDRIYWCLTCVVDYISFVHRRKQVKPGPLSQSFINADKNFTRWETNIMIFLLPFILLEYNPETSIKIFQPI